VEKENSAPATIEDGPLSNPQKTPACAVIWWGGGIEPLAAGGEKKGSAWWCTEGKKIRGRPCGGLERPVAKSHDHSGIFGSIRGKKRRRQEQKGGISTNNNGRKKIFPGSLLVFRSLRRAAPSGEKETNLPAWIVKVKKKGDAATWSEKGCGGDLFYPSDRFLSGNKIRPPGGRRRYNTPTIEKKEGGIMEVLVPISTQGTTFKVPFPYWRMLHPGRGKRKRRRKPPEGKKATLHQRTSSRLAP